LVYHHRPHNDCLSSSFFLYTQYLLLFPPLAFFHSIIVTIHW
jgi:hypothetical protein